MQAHLHGTIASTLFSLQYLNKAWSIDRFLDHVQCLQTQGIPYIMVCHLLSNLLFVLSYNLLNSRKRYARLESQIG